MTWLERFQNLLPSSKWPAMVRKPLRFFIVGTIGTFVQTGFFLMLMSMMNQPGQHTVLYYIAFIGGFILEMIPNYFCMSFYTFGSMPTKKNALGFLLARGVNLVIQLVILPLLLLWLDEIPNAILSPIVIFLAGIINFLMQWLFFKDNKPKNQLHSTIHNSPSGAHSTLHNPQSTLHNPMIYKANIIDTPTPESFRIIPNGYIHVNEHGVIEGVYETLPESLAKKPVTDYGDQLLIPAFYDLHIHAPQYRNMGLALDLPLLPWLQKYTFPEESKFCDLKYAERIYRRFVHELWMQGTMRSSIFATVHIPATQLLMKLLDEAGLGAYVGLVGMNRDCPEGLTNTLEDLETFYSQPGTDLVKPIITPRFIPSCTRDMLQRLGDLAKRYNLPVQSHLSENRNEIRLVHKLMPEVLTYGDGYLKYGLWGQTPTLMAHCCHTYGREMRLLQKHGVVVVHCPTSNCNLGSGAAPVRRFLKKGIRVALGTDVSGGHNASILRVMQYALQMSKLYQTFSLLKEPALKVSEAFYLATKSGGSFFGKCGSFEKGYEFDALVINDGYLNAEKYTLDQRIERYIFIGDDRDIRHRFCAGRELAEPKIE